MSKNLVDIKRGREKKLILKYNMYVEFVDNSLNIGVNWCIIM